MFKSSKTEKAMIDMHAQLKESHEKLNTVSGF
jgi:hypothetical protein